MIVDVLVIKYCDLRFICHLEFEIWNFIVSQLVREQSPDNPGQLLRAAVLHR